MSSLVLFTTILVREKVVQVKLNRLRKGTKQCVFILLVNSILVLYWTYKDITRIR